MTDRSMQFLTSGAFPDYGVVLERRFPDYYGLQYADAGALRLQVDDQVYEITEPCFWSTYPGPRFVMQPAEPYTFWGHHYISFRGPVVQHFIDEGLFPLEPQPVPFARRYGERLDHIMVLAERPDRLSQLTAVNLIEGILLELAEARMSPQDDASWLQTVLKRLREAPTSEPGYDALADELHMSTSSLRRRFKAAMGEPIHTYTLRRRVEAAGDLLVNTNLPIKAIASQQGYKDACYFSRQFKQVTGMTPARFRGGVR